MADVSLIKAGRWGLSRPLFVDGGWTTYAMEQRLGSLGVDNYFPPRQADGTPLCNAVLVRLSGTVTSPSDGNTVLFPRNLDDVGDVTLGELTVAQRNNLRNTLEAWLTGYQFTDWDGTVRVIPAFSTVTATYTNSTTLKQVARDVYRHFAHSIDRPRLLAGEVHNTQYLDNFDTDHETRWTALTSGNTGNGVWDSTDLEVDFSGDQNAYVRYVANNSGSLEHEAQITGRHTASGRMVGPGVRMSSNSGYGISVDLFGFVQLWKVVAGTRTNIYTSASIGSFSDLVFQTLRLAASGANGANVVLGMWYLTHTTTKPSDPGWTGTDGSPNLTYTDTAADRLDDSAVDLDCGILARGMVSSVDTRHDFFKLRALSDRAGSGQTVTVNQASETDLAQAIAVNPRRRLVNQITETELAQAITARKTRAVGQTAETDLAQAIARQKTKAVGQTTEADSAQALTARKAKLLGQVSETDLAQPVTRSTPGSIIVPVAEVTETETAQPIAWAPKRRLISAASETSQAQPLTLRKLKYLGIAIETDLAQALARSKTKPLAQIIETDLAQAVSWAPKRRLVAQAVETDTALAIAASVGARLRNVVEAVLHITPRLERTLRVSTRVDRHSRI